MGLFEDPFEDVDQASHIVAQPKYVADGLAAQRHSIVLLKNEHEILPAKEGLRIYQRTAN